MKCPYNYISTKCFEQTSNKINEETGACEGSCTTVVENYTYCECAKEECAVYYDGKCHFKC